MKRRNTVAVDGLLNDMATWPTDQLDALRNALNDNNPGLLDQIQAAAGDTRKIMPLLVGVTRAPVDVPQGDVPEWIRLSALDALLGWFQGDGRTCLHNPSPYRPQPVHAAAWTPGLIVCTHCLPLQKARTQTIDRTCDGCGHYCTGPEHGDGIRTMSVIIGALSYRAGVCNDCYQRFPPTEERETE